jgi:RND family efflux transporter MFP subunit
MSEHSQLGKRVPRGGQLWAPRRRTDCQKTVKGPLTMKSRQTRPLLLCLSLAVTGCSAAHAGVVDGAEARDPAIPVHTVKASAVTAPVTLELEGTLGPRRHARLSPLVSGHVAAISVELGDQVKAGAPLLTLRAADFRLAASAARARAEAQLRQLGLASDAAVDLEHVPSVAAAKAELDTASDALRRHTQLRGTGATTDESYEQSVLRHTAARARYESARQAVQGQLAGYAALRSEAALRRNDAANTIVRAPFAGRVAKKMAEIGEFVSPQSPVIELVDTSELRLTLQVPERHVARVHEGQRVRVSVDGSGIVREGVVRHIAAALDQDSRALTLEAAVPNDDGALRAGHFARARLDLGDTEELVSVPASALSERAGVFRVFVVAGGHAEARIVQVVERDGQRALVRGELTAAEAVVSAPPRGLSDGSKVQG